MTRRESRESAFMLLFEYGFNREKTLDELIESAWEEREMMTDDYARTVCEYAISHLTEIDEEINKYIEGRTAERLTRPARALLRTAVAEINLKDTPVAVAVNEAVELAKKYDGDEIPAYINGVLGSLLRGRKNG